MSGLMGPERTAEHSVEYDLGQEMVGHLQSQAHDHDQDQTGRHKHLDLAQEYPEWDREYQPG